MRTLDSWESDKSLCRLSPARPCPGRSSEETELGAVGSGYGIGCWVVSGTESTEFGLDRLRDRKPLAPRLAKAARFSQYENVVATFMQAAKARSNSIDLTFDPISEGSTFDQVPATVAAASGKGKWKVGVVLA